MPCVHKNCLGFSAFTSFYGYKDQQRTTATPKNIFHERLLYNGKYTQLTCLSEACQAVRYEFEEVFQLIIISFILMTLMFDLGMILKGEIRY